MSDRFFCRTDQIQSMDSGALSRFSSTFVWISTLDFLSTKLRTNLWLISCPFMESCIRIAVTRSSKFACCRVDVPSASHVSNWKSSSSNKDLSFPYFLTSVCQLLVRNFLLSLGIGLPFDVLRPPVIVTSNWKLNHDWNRLVLTFDLKIAQKESHSWHFPPNLGICNRGNSAWSWLEAYENSLDDCDPASAFHSSLSSERSLLYVL